MVASLSFCHLVFTLLSSFEVSVSPTREKRKEKREKSLLNVENKVVAISPILIFSGLARISVSDILPPVLYSERIIYI